MDSIKLGESSRTPMVNHANDPTTLKKKKVPKVAIYVLGATLGITVGLTALIIPFIRQAARLSKPGPNFISHRYIDRPLRSPPSPPSSSAPISSDLNGFEELKFSRTFNDREEARLYGPRRSKIRSGDGKEGEGDDGLDVDQEPVSPWMGAQALGIATAIVGGTAAVSAYVIAKLMGVSDMDEFAKKMRQNMSTTFPNAVARITRPDDEIPGGIQNFDSFVMEDGEIDEDAVAKWVKWVETESEIESERGIEKGRDSSPVKSTMLMTTTTQGKR